MPEQQPNQPMAAPAGKSKKGLLVGALVVALVALGAVWMYYSNPFSAKPTPTTNQNVNVSTEPTQPTSVTYQGQDGKNALELLKASHVVVESNGFVSSIDGRSNTRDIFWLYYVNGEPGQVGAADYQTKSSDTIEWRYEEFAGE